MSSRLSLAVDSSMEGGDRYRAMAVRLPAVDVVRSTAKYSALVTDNVKSALDALADGKRVLVVDPLHLLSADRVRLEALGRSMPAHVSRFQPAISQVKLAVDERKLGEPGLLRIHRWQEPSRSAGHALACELDLALWIFDDRPTVVYGIERPGYIQAHLGFSQGGMAIIDVDTTISPGNSYYALSLIGSSGAAYADDHHNMNLLIGDRGIRALLSSQRDIAVQNMIRDFVLAIHENRDFFPNWSDTDAALRLAAQVRTAATSECVIAAGGGDD